MISYTNIVRNVLENGKLKGNRTGVDTLAVPFVHFEHNMQDGFPLLTTKRMPFRTMAVELEGFIKGVTSKKWFQERQCKIWDEWANPVEVKRELIAYDHQYTMACEGALGSDDPDDYPEPYDEEELRKAIQKGLDDLGPIYGYQWRRFNEVYDEDDNGQLKGNDQFKLIVDTLHKNPLDRRMVCSAWNPSQIHIQALPPCHLLFNVVVIGDELHLGWHQRSVDLMLGCPLNIASYALLLLLFCQESGLKPGKLSGMLADCHIYENHIDAAKEQIGRTPRELPKLTITNWKDIYSWTHNDLLLEGYNPHPKLTMQVAV